MTEEHKKKIGLANSPLMKEKWKNPEYRNHMIEIHKGKKQSEETKEKRSEFMKKNPVKFWLGKKGYWSGKKRNNPEYIEKMRIGHLGKNTGEKNFNWKGGILPLVRIIRNSTKYKEWRDRIFQRDNFTCQITGKRSGNGEKIVLNVHHIKSFSDIIKENNIKSYTDALGCKELWDINNGITILAELNQR